MKLFEQLKLLNQEEDVFISSKSAFFFIGTPDEFEKMAPELDMQWYKTYFERITGAETKRNNHLKLKPSENMKPVVKKFYENGESVEKILDYTYFLESWQSKLSDCEKQIEHAKDLFYKFKPFRNREVIEVYRNIDNNATIVHVEGEETARFWFKSEWERFRKTGKVVIDDDDFIETDSDDEEYADSEMIDEE